MQVADTFHLGNRISQGELHIVQYIYHTNHQAGDHQGGLQGVGIYNCFYASFKSIQQNHE